MGFESVFGKVLLAVFLGALAGLVAGLVIGKLYRFLQMLAGCQVSSNPWPLYGAAAGAAALGLATYLEET